MQDKSRSIRRSEASSFPNRRAFLNGFATAAATGLLASGSFEKASAIPGSENSQGHNDAVHREQQAYQRRVDAAKLQRDQPLANHRANGDESRYANKIASFSKGLLHNSLGEVDLNAWNSMIQALESGVPEDFDRIVMNGPARLVNPQAGLAFDMEGPDSHALSIPSAPRFDSAEEAAEIAENYWMALLRDVSFQDYAADPLAGEAAQDLSGFSNFRGRKTGGRVTPSVLFRGLSAGEGLGPYISQFFWKDTPFGVETINRRMQTSAPHIDYMTTFSAWRDIQNGGLAPALTFDPIPRYIRNGRDLGEWVHRDVLFQAYFEALLILLHMEAPRDRANPYNTSPTQVGFGTLGDPFIASVLCAVATRALKAVWFQKWFVHLRLRPEVFAARVHNVATGLANYPINGEILRSSALLHLASANGTYLLPMAFPEGSPLHPSYGAGHATVAGACVTILKAFFDENFIIPNPVEADKDGLGVHPYSGPPLTVGGELDKLASNVALGRNFAGVHWRSDATESLKLGEELAISFLQEEQSCFNERFEGFSLTRFDGTTVTV